MMVFQASYAVDEFLSTYMVDRTGPELFPKRQLLLLPWLDPHHARPPHAHDVQIILGEGDFD